jgi:hypothetical protein
MGKNMETGDVERKWASVALLDTDTYVAPFYGRNARKQLSDGQKHGNGRRRAKRANIA